MTHKDIAVIGSGRFHTTPEDRFDRQPYTNSFNQSILAVDGRLDNRDEIISTLEVSAVDAKRLSDAELFFLCYIRWGRDLVNRIIGDFAIAIWDPVERRVFLLRDHFGVRPLYYLVDNDGRIVFGSEIRALRVVSKRKTVWNETKILSVLGHSYIDWKSTMYEGIYRVPAASIVSLDPWSGSESVHKYWDLEPREQHVTDAEAVEGFRQHFESAVRSRLRANGPVTSQLSGGLDSASGRYYGLNKVGHFILERIQEERLVDEIAADVAQRFDTTREQAATDALSSLDELVQAGLITVGERE